MHKRSIMMIAATTLAVSACNPFHREPVTEVTRDANANLRWQASLVTPASLAGAVQMKGTASMQPGRDAAETDIRLQLDNATPGGAHPWRVHRGTCDSDLGLFGAPGDYGTLRVGDEGRGSANATVRMTTPTYGDYHVTVYASAANSQTIVACGNLAAPAR